MNPQFMAQQLNAQLHTTVPGQTNEQGENVTMMDMFNNFLTQNNGIGNLLGSSLGDMFEEGELAPIYRHIFKVFNGTEIIALLLHKNFSTLNTKRAEFK